MWAAKRAGSCAIGPMIGDSGILGVSLMIKRILLVLVVAISFFAWGVATGVYRGFPWPTVYAVGQQVTGILRQMGLMSPRPEDVLAPVPQRVTSQVNSGLLNFDLTVINSADPLPGQGGGMALTDDGFLIARDFDGAVKFYSFKSDHLSTLAFKLPAVNAGAKMQRRAGAIMHQAALAGSRAGETVPLLAIRFGGYRPAEFRWGRSACAACSV